MNLSAVNLHIDKDCQYQEIRCDGYEKCQS